MLELETLYKRTATGAIQEWTIFAERGKYWTVSGQTDGKKVQSTPTVCKPKNVGKKNETTTYEQAELEAKAKWQKKIDEGYVVDQKNIDAAKILRIDPMLAKNYNDYKEKLGFPLYSQPKLDGLRCVATPRQVMSRKWKPFSTLEHIRAAVAQLCEEHKNILALDGEMYSHELKDKFEEIVSIVKQPKATAEDIERAKKLVQYHVYDYVDVDPTLTFEQRTANLNRYIKKLDRKYFKFVETELVTTRADLDALFEEYYAQGYEGQMIRVPASKYEQKRTSNLLKRKEFIDEEFEIVGYKDGKGSRTNCITLRVVTEDGKEFDSVPKGSVEYLQKLWDNRDKLIGLKATIKFQNYSDDGIPRFNNTIKIRNKNLEEFVV
jgi:DNA ligase 1